MSEHDDMDDLKRLLSQSPPPPPDPGARARALAAATAAFEAEGVATADSATEAEEKKIQTNLQGTTDVSRQRDRQSGLMTLMWRRLMNLSLPSTKQLMMGGASLAVIAIAVVAVQNPDMSLDRFFYQNAAHDGAGAPARTEDLKEVRERSDTDTVARGETSAPAEPQPPVAVDGTLADKDVGGDEAFRTEAPAQAVVEETEAEPTVIGEFSVAPPPSSDDAAATGGAAGGGRLMNAPRDAELSAAPRPMSSVENKAAVDALTRRQGMQKLGAAKPAAEADLRAEPVPAPTYEQSGRDRFPDAEEAQVKVVTEEPVSTFSVDVDTASYSFMRGALNRGILPAKDSIRLEELINYFPYDYAGPESRETPFAANVAVMDTPWNEGTRLMRIGIKGYEISQAEKPKSNLVFLIDTSGSMNAPDKLPLLIQSFEMLLSTLDADDTVSIVAYAGSAGVVLEPTKASEKDTIRGALRRLGAGGSTAGGQGVRRAYELAEANRIEDGINRVILATDGDFNVGIQNTEELKGFIERKRDTGVFLSVLGFGRGNYNDALMQVLAQNGNGVAAYIDSVSEAQKVLVDEATSSLFPIAKDVKIQVEFNPNVVAEYRLIGYETRALNREDFNNDKVDAAEIGAGHTVTALYEITPVGSDARLVEPSRYDRPAAPAGDAADSDVQSEYAHVRIRYKEPDADTSKLIERPVTPADETAPDDDARFAAAVAAFGQMLKGGRYTGDFTYDDVIALANGAKGADPFNYRGEFVQLVRKAKTAAAMQRQ